MLSCADQGAGVTFAIRVYDPDGEFSDCAVWGHDPAGLVRGDYGLPGTMLAEELAACLDWPESEGR